MEADSVVAAMEATEAAMEATAVAMEEMAEEMAAAAATAADSVADSVAGSHSSLYQRTVRLARPRLAGSSRHQPATEHWRWWGMPGLYQTDWRPGLCKLDLCIPS